MAHFKMYDSICLEILRNTATIVRARILPIHYKPYMSLSYTSVMVYYII